MYLGSEAIGLGDEYGARSQRLARLRGRASVLRVITPGIVSGIAASHLESKFGALRTALSQYAGVRGRR
jgi:hypothetical protein